MKKLAFLLVLVGCLSARADTLESAQKIEIGAVAGYPVGVGMLVGYWGPQHFPVVARLATGLGTTLDLGWGFKSDDDVRAYVALSVGAFGYLGILAQTQYFIGPSIGMRWRSLFFAVGPTVRFESGSNARLLAMGQVGVSGLF